MLEGNCRHQGLHLDELVGGIWRPQRDSNLWPVVSETTALSVELCGLLFYYGWDREIRTPE